MVNPYEVEKVADAMYSALTMDKAEAEIRMVSLRNREQKNDLEFLLNTFLKEMGSDDVQGIHNINIFFISPITFVLHILMLFASLKVMWNKVVLTESFL